MGTAYIALFCLCLARASGGQFILRIEDTDAARSTRAAEANILASLRWLGLDWDEGPDKGGPFGPYRQSERLTVYRQYVDQLLDAGHAFHCFCTAERLATMRAEQMQRGETGRYDGECMSLSAEAVSARLANGEPSVVRMKVPSEGTCIVKDKLRGDIEIDWSQIDMQVLLKSDGNPTYHLAVVVDDHLMEISHVIRGEEWINSAPKHILLYDYFGWQMPELIHMPLLRNPDKSKLSKRKHPTSIRFYERMGFMPEALLNYLGMLGWSMPGGEEKFSVAAMIEHFDISRISLGAPVFDVDKLRWLNGRWLREDLSDDEFADRMVEWAYNRETLLKIIPLIRERVDAFSDVAPLAGFFVEGLPRITAADLVPRNLSAEDTLKALQFCLWALEAVTDWRRDAIQTAFQMLADRTGMKIRDLLAPVFVAVSGKPVAPPLFDSIEILGPDMTMARLRHALGVMGGVSNKQAKRLEKQYRSLDA